MDRDPHIVWSMDLVVRFKGSSDQGSESSKICLVLVPFFSASSQNVLVLVPYFSALALSTKITKI